MGYITTILSYQSDVGDFRSPGRDNDHSIPVVGVYRQLMKKKKKKRGIAEDGGIRAAFHLFG